MIGINKEPLELIKMTRKNKINLSNTEVTGTLTKMMKKDIRNSEIGKVPTIDISYDQYLARKFGNYIEINGEKALIQGAIEEGLPLLIEGDKGIGKTMAVITTCAEMGCAIVPYACSSGTTMGDILGRTQLRGDNSVFELGVLPKSIMVANHFKKGVLYLDELSSLEPEIQKLLNPLIDDRREIVVNDTVYSIDEGVMYTVIASQNPIGYQGTNPLNEDLRSRFIGEAWRYPPSVQIDKVIDWTDIEPKHRKQLLQLATDTLSSRQKGDIEYVISIRDISLFTRVYRMWKMKKKDPKYLEKAIHNGILIKYAEMSERELIKSRAEETFGVKLE